MRDILPMKPRYSRYGDVSMLDKYLRNIKINYFNLKYIFYQIIIEYSTNT